MQTTSFVLRVTEPDNGLPVRRPRVSRSGAYGLYYLSRLGQSKGSGRSYGNQALEITKRAQHCVLLIHMFSCLFFEIYLLRLASCRLYKVHLQIE